MKTVDDWVQEVKDMLEADVKSDPAVTKGNVGRVVNEFIIEYLSDQLIYTQDIADLMVQGVADVSVEDAFFNNSGFENLLDNILSHIDENAYIYEDDDEDEDEEDENEEDA